MRWNELNVIFVFLCGSQSCLFTSHIVVIFWHSFEKSLTSISGAGQFLVFSILKVLLFYVSFQWLTIPICSRRQSEMAHYSYLHAKAVSDGWLFILAREGSLKWLTIPTCTRRQFQMAEYSYLHACARRQFPMADYLYMHEKAVSNDWLFLPAQEGSFKWLIIPICTFAGERRLCVMWWELVTFSQWRRAWLKQQILISLSSKTRVGGTRVRRLILAKP